VCDCLVSDPTDSKHKDDFDLIGRGWTNAIAIDDKVKSSKMPIKAKGVMMMVVEIPRHDVEQRNGGMSNNFVVMIRWSEVSGRRASDAPTHGRKNDGRKYRYVPVVYLVPGIACTNWG
jgi:hypothetical protein